MEKKKNICRFQERHIFQKSEKNNSLSYQGTQIIVNLKNLKANLSFIKSKVDKKTKIMSVVKAFGYGSDPLKISKFLERNGVDYFAVAYVNEGIALRNAGIKLPVLVLHPQADDFDEIIKYNLEPNIYSFRILNAFIKKSKSHPFHLKFNTGLNRLGFSINDIEGLHYILKERANIKYLFSHLGASEDRKEKNYTMNQIHLFEKICTEMERRFEKSFKKHLLNTSGILNYPEFKCDMVRTGIGLYGYGNDKMFSKYLKPVLSLKSVISQIHDIEKGQSVGYNRGFIAKKDCKIAIIPIGHADGISRSLGNGKVGFLIKNKIAKTIGNICMDMLMLDISNINCKEGDEVSIIDENSQTAEDLGELTDTISYEILTSLSTRIKRIII